LDHPIRDEVNRGPKPTSPSTSLTSNFTGRLAVPMARHSGTAVGDHILFVVPVQRHGGWQMVR
jgi:hypothetical protein